MELFYNISDLVTVRGTKAKKGSSMNDVSGIKNGAFVTDNGKFVFVGSENEALKLYPDAKKTDCEGMAVLPAFIDSHTHLVFGGYREKEFNLRMNGENYMEIMKRGGGIAYTTKKTREASEDELFAQGMRHLLEMKAYGIATVEIKSGYGLDLEAELKQLSVIKRLREASGMNITATFMGAHAVPAEFKGDGDAYIDYIIETVLPEIKKQGIAEFCDIFCEINVFNSVQAERLFKAAEKLGFGLKIHADEMADSGTAAFACRSGCVSADHLLYVSDEGIKAFAESDTIAALLPATAFSLRDRYAPARKLIDGGAAVTVASDFNPGSCFCNSLPFLIALSTINMNMTVNETITALTLNAAASLGKADTLGSIEEGKQADFVILNWESPDFLSYHIANNNVKHLYIKGKKQF